MHSSIYILSLKSFRKGHTIIILFINFCTTLYLSATVSRFSSWEIQEIVSTETEIYRVSVVDDNDDGMGYGSNT